jgi:hypothetical protein
LRTELKLGLLKDLDAFEREQELPRRARQFGRSSHYAAGRACGRPRSPPRHDPPHQTTLNTRSRFAGWDKQSVGVNQLLRSYELLASNQLLQADDKIGGGLLKIGGGGLVNVGAPLHVRRPLFTCYVPYRVGVIQRD